MSSLAISLGSATNFGENRHEIESLELDTTASSHLFKKAIGIRKMRIDWRNCLAQETIDTDGYNFITEYDNAMPAVRNELFNKNPQQAVKVFILLISSIKKDQTLQYLLTMFDDLLQEDKSRVEIVREYFQSNEKSLYQTFFNLLQYPDFFVNHQSSRIIAKFACWSKYLMDHSDLKLYFDWLCNQLRILDNQYLQTVARNLQMMLRIRLYRMSFIEYRGVDALAGALSHRVDAQISYQLIFCLWCLSFDDESIGLLHQQRLIPVLSDIVCSSTKEKVIRITAAFLRQLLEKSSETSKERECSLALIHCNVLKQFEIMHDRNLEHDPELKEDLEYLVDKLQKSLRDVTTLEEYEVEIRSGRLQWTPPHKSEKFWFENIQHFNERNYDLLKILVRLLEVSNEPVVLSVAVHDLGQYVRHYPRGKDVIDKLGGKSKIMGLLSHPESEVRYNSLIALQKIMVHNWEYLGQQLESKAMPTASATTKA